MPRNMSEKFPYGEALRAYLVVWAQWDRAGMPRSARDGSLQMKKVRLYQTLGYSDRNIVREWGVTRRRQIVKRYKL